MANLANARRLCSVYAPTMGYFTLVEQRDGCMRYEVVERSDSDGETRTVALLACALGAGSEPAVRELLRVVIEGGLAVAREPA